MAVDVQIRFRASSGEARREMDQLKKEVQSLRQQLGQSQRTATEATAAVDKLGDEAREAAIGVTSLGRNIFKTSAEARKFAGVFTDAQGRLRESNGEFAKTTEQIDRLGDEARESAREVDLLGDRLSRSGRGVTDYGRSSEGASRGTSLFTRALGGVGRVLAEVGVLSATHLLVEFTKGTVNAAGRLELLTTGLENVEGSSEAAQRRLSELDEIARLPGANLDSLIQFSNRMRSIGISTEETDSILKNVGQSVVVLGGNAYTATEALEQISQALQKNTIIMHDFRPIIQRIPGFLQAVADVHGVEPTLDGMRYATERLGGSVKDALLPVLEELGNRFEAPPPESYVRSIDELHNSFFLFQATLGDKFLPAIAAGARGLAELFDTMREFLQSDEPVRSAEAFAASLDKINSAASRQQALEDRVLALRRHELALKSQRAGLSNSSEAYLNLSKQIQAAQNEQDRWNTVLARSPKSVALLENEIAGLNARYEVLRKRLEQTDGTRTTASLAQTQRQFDEVSTSLSVTNKLLADVESGFLDTADATDTAAAAIRPAVGSVNEFGGALNQIDTRFLTFHERVDVLTRSIRGLPPEIAAVRSGFDVLTPTTERVAAVFENLNTSLVSSQNEVNALDAVTQQILQDLQDLEGLAHVRAVIADRTDVQNANLINQSIAEAVRSFRGYNDVLLEAGVNFRNIEDISADVTASIRTQASAYDELRQSVDGVALSQSQLQGQQIGSNVFDPSTLLNPRFDARTPGSSFQTDFSEQLGNINLRLGQQLGSQAIRTAGELRRIEQERVESLEDLEREYSEQIIAINEEKRQKLAAVEQEIEEERLRRIASIEEAFQDAANAEVEARQDAADRILQIEARAAEQRERLRERLNERLIALEERRDDRIQDLSDGFIEREQDRQQEILEITERAAAARVEAEHAYAVEVQAINNRLFEDVLAVQRELTEEIESLESGYVQRQADRADEIVRITEEAAESRAAANRAFTDTLQGIYNDLVTAWDALEEGFTERQADRAEERIEIEQSAADARIAANEAYAESVARISTDLVDEVRRIESEIVDVQRQHAEDRIAIEQESLEDRAEANAAYARSIADIESERDRQLEEHVRRLAEIQQEAATARLSADEDYADRFQDIQNDLVDRVVGIQRNLNDTLNDLRDEQLDAERERADSLVELHEETQQKLEDLERRRTQSLEDLRRKFQRDQLDAAEQLDRDLEDAQGDPEKEAAARQKFNRRIEDLTREFHRRQIDLQINQRRQQEALARQAAAKEVEIAERAQARQAEIAQQQTDARTQAQEGITAADSAAGVAFQDAQANYVPALSAHEQALLAHAEALNSIAATEASDIASVNTRIAEIIETSFQDAATAAMTLAETLAAVDSAEKNQLGALNTTTSGTVAGLQGDISAAEARTGLSFEDALQNYTPAVDLNTQALNTLTDALAEIDAGEVTALAGVSAAGVADRATTTEAQQALVTGAGVSIEDARANFVPALSSAAQATLTLNETMRSLETSFRETIADIHTAGLVDRQAIDDAVAAAIADASAQQTALETAAGTTFADASLAFQPGLSAIDQAAADKDDTLAGINQQEIEDIDAVNAQSIADRLETDAAITETRDAYIKARDTELFRHNTAILQLNQAEAADIKAVRATLSKNLESIDDKLDLELAEIRDAKIVFDTRIGELINAINAEANQDVTALKADTAAMRDHLNVIAEEAKNNEWKSALLKVANVGITIAGVAAGTALGNPVAGFAVGQAVGGLVEEGGNELLFHYHRTDTIARRLAQQETLRRTRSAPQFFPTQDQIRNARDVSREIVAGVTEGLNIGNRTDGGFGGASQEAGLPNEISATIQIEFPDGSITELTDQIIRLRDQDRVNL